MKKKKHIQVSLDYKSHSWQLWPSCFQPAIRFLCFLRCNKINLWPFSSLPQASHSLQKFFLLIHYCCAPRILLPAICNLQNKSTNFFLVPVDGNAHYKFTFQTCENIYILTYKSHLTRSCRTSQTRVTTSSCVGISSPKMKRVTCTVLWWSYVLHHMWYIICATAS